MLDVERKIFKSQRKKNKKLFTKREELEEIVDKQLPTLSSQNMTQLSLRGGSALLI